MSRRLRQSDDDFGPNAGSVPQDYFTWVVDDRVIAMSRPSDRELAALAARGITHVVSLTVRPLDAQRLAELGLASDHLPLPDMSAPSLADITTFVDCLSSLLADGQKVAVHCGAGLGRTGTMIACYLVSTGMSAADAISEVRSRRPGAIESAAQERAVCDYASHMAS